MVLKLKTASIFKRSNGLLHNKSACQEYFMKNNTLFDFLIDFFKKKIFGSAVHIRVGRWKTTKLFFFYLSLGSPGFALELHY